MARNSSEFYKGDHAFAIRTFLRRIIDLPKLMRPALYNTTLLLARFTENLNLQRCKEAEFLIALDSRQQKQSRIERKTIQNCKLGAETAERFAVFLDI